MGSLQRRLISVFVACFASFVFVVSAALIIHLKEYQNERERYHFIANNEIENIITTVDCVMARVYTLSAMVKDNDGRTDFFDKMAKDIYTTVWEETGVQLKNIALAPEGIVEKVYPMNENEGLIGFNFMDSTKPGNLEAIEAYKNGRTILTNPFPLVQGGVGIAGRSPVILDMDNNTELLWGLVTVTMDYENLMDTLNLKSITKMGSAFSLGYYDSENKYVEMQGVGRLGKNPVTHDFKVRNLNWRISVMPEKSWITPLQILPSIAVIILIMWLVGMYTNIYLNLKISHERLEYLSYTDALTGVYSRNYVNTILINMKDGTWQDKKADYSLMIIDIDNFKSYNDTYGHEMGDKIIVTVAKVLADSINERAGDCVIRFGGDEFIIIVNNGYRQRMESISKKIIDKMNEPNSEKELFKKITVSGGVALFDECEDRRYKSMMIAADKKLYIAKEKGKNRIEM